MANKTLPGFCFRNNLAGSNNTKSNTRPVFKGKRKIYNDIEWLKKINTN